MKGRLVALAVGIMIITGIILSVGDKREKSRTYQVMNPIVCSLSEYVQCDGVVESTESYYISPEKVGNIERVYVSKGEKVSTDELLFTVETDGAVKDYRSPAEGIVEMVALEKGMPGIPQLTFVKISTQKDLTVSIYIDEDDMSRVTVGQPVKITMDAYSGRRFSGVIETVESCVETQGDLLSQILNREKRIVTAKVDIETDGDLFMPGLSVHAEVLTDIREKTMLIPCRAVLQDEKGYYVYELDGNRIIRTGVERGEYRSGYYEIKYGLQPERQYIVDPDDELIKTGQDENES